MFEAYLKNGAKRKFIVIKIDDLIKHVNSAFKLAMLDNDLKDIQAGRKADGKEPCPEYLVINTDEPYAGEIIDIMKRNGHWGSGETLQFASTGECPKCGMPMDENKDCHMCNQKEWTEKDDQELKDKQECGRNGECIVCTEFLFCNYGKSEQYRRKI